jgi:predicted ATPase/class 3 adenylate cyclase
MAQASRVGDSSRVTTVQPAGTVTLVFTDVEGSTKLLDSLGPEEYRRALGEHREALRAAFERHGGYEVDTAGDGFFYAFSTATGAARAVRDTLETLEGGPVRIRVGVHTGEPILDPPKYVGLDVHRAARIMAAAHGGQALLSRSTCDLLGAGFEVRDLGEHRLKDLSAPQRLFQLGVAEFPRPRTLHQTNLPVPATEFLGRSRELDEVVERLRNGVRLLTLTGPGGTGKTRLALQAAAEAADAFDDGVWWVPLAALRDPALVLRHTAQTLDVIEQADRLLEDVLAEMLGGKRMLILLDNAEHLLPRAAESIAAIRDLGGPKLVVTSRERLQLAGEHVYPVPQLTAPEGVGLFTARAVAIDPAFEATGAVTELCDRLDNLPLALELAAARTAVLRPEQILDRLGNRLDLLKGGRDADPRQHTLRATIAWSFDLIDGDESELFSRFAVFAGSATLEAVEEVCGAELDTLASLVDKSLVRREGDRYWMLETIREFGRDQLDEIELEGVVERHGAFYERFAGEAEAGLRGPAAAVWLALVEQELPNLRTGMSRALERGLAGRAARTATGIGRYWHARSSATEGRSWIDQALAAGSMPDSDRSRASRLAGYLAFFQGDLTAAAALFSQSAELAQAAGDVFVEAGSLAGLGWVSRELGDSVASELLERSRALLVHISDPWERSEVLLPLSAGESDESRSRRPAMEEVLALKREAGDVMATSDSLNNLGWDAMLRGDYDDAVSKLEEARAIARELEDAFRIALATGNLGLTAVLQERYRDGLALLRESLVLCLRRGDQWGGAETVLGLAAATAGLAVDELSVRLDSIQRALFAEPGIVYTAILAERLDRPLRSARERLGPERVAAIEGEFRKSTLDLALELLDDQVTSIASPNE